MSILTLQYLKNQIDNLKRRFCCIASTEYADNATALAAGLTIGALYRTGDIVKIVHA